MDPAGDRREERSVLQMALQCRTLSNKKVVGKRCSGTEKTVRAASAQMAGLKWSRRIPKLSVSEVLLKECRGLVSETTTGTGEKFK